MINNASIKGIGVLLLLKKVQMLLTKANKIKRHGKSQDLQQDKMLSLKTAASQTDET